MSCEGGAARHGGVTWLWKEECEKRTYVLSHWAIQPEGSFGRAASVGPESGDTGGRGGVGTDMDVNVGTRKDGEELKGKRKGFRERERR